MLLHFYTVDAFTNEVFRGNPAGVQILKGLPSEVQMQAIAAEMNLSETAFVDVSSSSFKIKFYAPQVEVDLCGHATLSSAHLMYELGLIPGESPIVFESNVGPLTCRLDHGWISMDLPASSATPSDDQFPFQSTMGVVPQAMYTTSNNWVIGLLETASEVKNCQPDFKAMIAGGLGFCMITAPSDDPEIDFVSRVFVPKAGIDEDPVTGSAHCVLGPLWQAILGKDELDALQVSKRGGRLKVKVQNNGRVLVKGQARTVFRLESLI